ncbi:MAG: tetratricopeptide repeat protein [Candidatus Hodarchaeales archaeon]
MKLINQISNLLVFRKIRKLINEWKLEEALQHIENLEEEHKIVGICVIGELYLILGRMETTYQLVEPLLQIAIKRQKKELEGRIRFIIAFALAWLTRFEHAQLEINNWEKEYEFLDHGSKEATMWESNLTYVKGIFHWRKGNYKSALNFLQRSLFLSKLMGGKTHIAFRLYYIGIVYHNNGDMKLAMQSWLESQTLAEITGHIIISTYCLYWISIYDYRQGDPDLALEKLQKVLSVFKQELPVSIEAIAYPVHAIGLLYYRNGNLPRAYQYVTESLEIREAINHHMGIATSLFDLIQLSTELDVKKEAYENLNQLQTLSKKTQHPIIKLQSRLAEAFIFKTSNRLYEKMRAYEIFRQILEEKVINYELTVFAILNLCDLLVIEIQITNDEEALKEVEDLFQKLIDLGHQQNTYSLVIEALLLQSKVFLVLGNANKAENYLEQARITAEMKSLLYLVPKISQHQDMMNMQLSRWIDLATKHAEMRERLIEADLQNYIQQCLQLITKAPSDQIFIPAD